MAIGLRSLMPAGSLSVRSLLNSTGTADGSTRRQAARILIDRKHVATGGLTGPIGLPFGVLQDAGPPGAYVKDYTGGTIQLADFSDGPQGKQGYRADITFVGFRVSDTNDTSSDEPYFILGVTGSNTDANVNMRTNIAVASVKSGNNVILQQTIATAAQPPFTLSVVGMDHDSGDPDEAAGKVEQSLKDAAAKITLALPLIGIPPAVGAYATTFLSIFGDWIGKGLSALFGMGDDVVGQSAQHFFDYDANTKTWVTPPAIPNPDFTVDHNVEIRLNNGGDGGGDYTAFFKVQLFLVNDVVV